MKNFDKLDNFFFDINYKLPFLGKLLSNIYFMFRQRTVNKNIIHHKKDSFSPYVFGGFLVGMVFLAISILWFTSKTGLISVGDDLIKSDWLQFWGSFLSFLGSILLGGLSLWQNYRLDKINKRITAQNSISTFYSYLIPESVVINHNYKKNFRSDYLAEDAFQVMYMENPPIPIREAEKLDRAEINIRFKNRTNTLPIKFFIKFLKISVLEDKNSNTIISRYNSDKNIDFENNFTFDEEIDTQKISIQIPIYEDKKVEYERLFNQKYISLDLIFYYINPFNILAKCDLSLIVTNPVVNKNSTSYSQLRLKINSFECTYQEV